LGDFHFETGGVLDLCEFIAELPMQVFLDGNLGFEFLNLERGLIQRDPGVDESEEGND
jgi:hypothetical protein